MDGTQDEQPVSAGNGPEDYDELLEEIFGGDDASCGEKSNG